ncbi:MAG: ATP-dependent DNA ligase [Actinobacteria bacterium]|nr:ATP-dependent DNA ligase [Actinomycetota bacterium]
MQYALIVDLSQRVASTPKRTEKVAAIAGVLHATPPALAPTVVGMLVGEPRQGRMGVGWATLRDVRVAPAAEPTVTVERVDEVLTSLAGLGGEGSQRERERVLSELMAELTADEQFHLVRLFGGEMRQGANDGVVADAVAKAAGVPSAVLRRAAMLLGDLGAAAQRALAGESLDVGLTPGVGVQPMLAGTAATVADALALTGPASVEWKLDGARVQVHRHGGNVRVLTRSLRDITAAVPEIVTAVSVISASEFVLDGEALGLDEDGAPLKFQDSMSGGSALRPFFFDVLHLGGTSLIDEPLHVRKAALADALPASLRLPTLDTADADAAEVFSREALAAGHEGVMVKALDSPYQAGRRGATWRKVKPVHTLDLVVLAAEWGHGRRTGWLSNLHLGARGEDGTFVMVGKTFKGLTDELLRWQTVELQARALGAPEDGYIQHVRPELVVEIALDGVQRSRRYPGGVALRFARVRRYRPDKQASDADTIERVQSML